MSDPCFRRKFHVKCSTYLVDGSELFQSTNPITFTFFYLYLIVDFFQIFTMITRTGFILALLCSSGHSFTQLPQSSKLNSIRLFSSTFDVETSSPTERRFADEQYAPSDEDISAIEAAFSKSNGKGNGSDRMSSIEREFPNKRKIKASVRETGTDSMKEYMKSMCNHELLNKNEEIILAREIQILLKWEDQRDYLENQLLR